MARGLSLRLRSQLWLKDIQLGALSKAFILFSRLCSGSGHCVRGGLPLMTLDCSSATANCPPVSSKGRLAPGREIPADWEKERAIPERHCKAGGEGASVRRDPRAGGNVNRGAAAEGSENRARDGPSGEEKLPRANGWPSRCVRETDLARERGENADAARPSVCV